MLIYADSGMKTQGPELSKVVLKVMASLYGAPSSYEDIRKSPVMVAGFCVCGISDIKSYRYISKHFSFL